MATSTIPLDQVRLAISYSKFRAAYRRISLCAPLHLLPLINRAVSSAMNSGFRAGNCAPGTARAPWHMAVGS